MSIRRVGKSDRNLTGVGKSRAGRETGAVSGANFAQQLDTIAALRENTAVEDVAPATATQAAGEAMPTPYQRREQLAQTDELLDSLGDLEKNLGADNLEEEAVEDSRRRLRETRDQALRTLSETPKSGNERALLHRTAVLATVELAKSERGDYN
ncbi:MAG: hypothetical protein HQL52_03605 [Magnetococcales bacterium]|nr:hypothetical protein [Magnetococcales bacterium]